MICGLATYYSTGDKYTPNHGVMANGEKFNSENYTIAHRILKLGTNGLLCNHRTRRCVGVRIADRGPYGAVMGSEWEVQRVLKSGWKYRGEFDVTPAVYKALKIRALSDTICFIEEVAFYKIGKNTFTKLDALLEN